MICKDADRGFFTYYCEKCDTVNIVHFGCNSRICTNCGKNHTDKRAKSLKKILFNVKITEQNIANFPTIFSLLVI
ncbi:MAG: transposase zinc-binding domain-containing protein [Methanosarcinales archaeon]|nr:transposase zinc-binding domain-containing protein [Methanosarcinales archaeon]